MSRLWDKGVDLDQRVLQYTAGDDYALDERLVKYDVRASIAHAEMLHAAKLLDAADLGLIRDGLNNLGADHAAGKWRIELADEDGQTALDPHSGSHGATVARGTGRKDHPALLHIPRPSEGLAEKCGAI